MFRDHFEFCSLLVVNNKYLSQIVVNIIFGINAPDFPNNRWDRVSDAILLEIWKIKIGQT